MITGTTNRRHFGFNLVELSVVLTIISAVGVSFLGSMTNNDEDEKRRITIERMETVIEAIENYAASHNFMPCPGGNLIFNDTQDHDGLFDDDDYDFAVDARAGTSCFSPESITSANTGGFISRAGVVPVHALGLPIQYTLDGWGRRLTYIVDSRKTEATAGLVGQGYEESGNHAGLMILDENDNSVIGNPTIYDWQESTADGVDVDSTFLRDFAAENPGTYNPTATPDDDADTATQTAILAIISHGPNGFGAMETNSTNTINFPTSGVGTEYDFEKDNAFADNSGDFNFDSVLRSVPESNNSATYIFDDIIMYRTKAQLNGRGPN